MVHLHFCFLCVVFHLFIFILLIIEASSLISLLTNDALDPIDLSYNTPFTMHTPHNSLDAADLPYIAIFVMDLSHNASVLVDLCRNATVPIDHDA